MDGPRRAGKGAYRSSGAETLTTGEVLWSTREQLLDLNVAQRGHDAFEFQYLGGGSLSICLVDGSRRRRRGQRLVRINGRAWGSHGSC